MNENRRIRFWQIAVLLLVLCNIGLMLVIWLKPNHDGGEPPKHPGPRDFVVSSLKLTDDQTRRYDTLINEHQKAMHRLRDEAMEYRQLLFRNLKSGQDGNTHYTDSLAQLVANNQKQIELVTYQHFAQVRELCTETQKATFDQIIGEVIKKMNGPHRGGPRQGDGQGPGDRQGPPQGDRQGPPPSDRQGPPPPDGDGHRPPPGPDGQ